jgi:predicted outer membrane repeat protein
VASGAALVALGTAPSASAESLTPVPCSAAALNAAISGATAGEVLSLTPGCVYTLDGPLPDVTVDLTILGNYATMARDTAAGAPVFTMLTIDSGVTAQLREATMRNGLTAESSGASGGAIDNEGSLTVTGSSFTGNESIDGGAIFNDGTLTVIASSFSGNTGGSSIGGRGGAIENVATLTVKASVFTGNSGQITGGAIWNVGSATVTGSAFVSNTSGTSLFTGSGGAIKNDGTLTLSGSILTGNSVSTNGSGGGGLDNEGQATVTGSTFLRNRVTGPASVGGGILNGGPSLTIGHTVVTGNTAASDGGGIYTRAGTVSLSGSAVTRNNPDNCAPPGAVAGCTG